MKKYTFEIVITEGSNKFWDDINRRGRTGCDEVADLVANCFDLEGLDPEIRLSKFEDV